MAAKTIQQFVERAIRLYEQEPGEADASARFGSYVRRWVGWAQAGLAVADIPARNGAFVADYDPLWPSRRQYGQINSVYARDYTANSDQT